MNNYFVFDVDGTLLNDEGRLEDSTIGALNKIQKNEDKIILASARPLPGIYYSIEDLNFEIDLFVALNGALICKQGEIIADNKINKTTVLDLAKIVQKMNLSLNFYTKDKWYVYGTDKLINKEADIVNMTPERLSNFEQMIDKEIFKILILGDKSNIKKMATTINRDFESVKATISKPNYCEIVHFQASKGKGVLKIIHSVNTDEDKKIIVFGDGENDISMMQKADLSIAMGNSNDKVKSQADFVTKSNNQAGILYAFNKFNLLGDDK